MHDAIVDIWLVEDNPNEVTLTLRALKKYNLSNRIHVVRDGAEALEFVFNTGAYAQRGLEPTPKVILLDLKLPKVDGIESYRLGMNSYIVKPADFEQFTEAMRQLGLYWVLLNQPSLLPRLHGEEGAANKPT